MALPQPVTLRPITEFPKLEKVYLDKPSHIGGSMFTLLSREQGWDITVRTDLQGLIAVHRTGEFWIPFAAVRNGIILK